MISALDVRIGNLVKVSEVIYTITGISELEVSCKGHEGSFAVEEIYPIPLTAELLEQAGFKELKKSSWYDKVPNEGFSYKLRANRVMIFHPGENTLSHSLNTYIAFFHQLQNLYYCLTGREITLQINAETTVS